jgi:hypothetical protein
LVDIFVHFLLFLVSHLLSILFSFPQLFNILTHLISSFSKQLLLFSFLLLFLGRYICSFPPFFSFSFTQHLIFIFSAFQHLDTSY